MQDFPPPRFQLRTGPPRLAKLEKWCETPWELGLNPWELGWEEPWEYHSFPSQAAVTAGGTRSISSFTPIFGRGRNHLGTRAALPGDQGPFLAAKPGSSKQGFGIELGHTHTHTHKGTSSSSHVCTALGSTRQTSWREGGEAQLPSVALRGTILSWRHHRY